MKKSRPIQKKNRMAKKMITKEWMMMKIWERTWMTLTKKVMTTWPTLLTSRTRMKLKELLKNSEKTYLIKVFTCQLDRTVSYIDKRKLL